MNRSELSDKELAAAAALAHGDSTAEVAEEWGIPEARLQLWMREHPWFQAAINRSRGELHRQTTDGLRSLLPEAVEALRRALENPDLAPTLALKLLALSGYANSKTAMIGARTADAIVDARAVAQSNSPLAVHTGPTERERQQVLAQLERMLSVSD